MNDTYVECLVERKPVPASGAIKAGAYALTAVFMLAGIFWYMPVTAAGVLMLIADYFLLPCLNVEYEYLYMQKCLTIDCIYSKEKRKKTADYDLEKMEIFAEEGSERLNSYNNRDIPSRDFSSGYPGRKRFIMMIHTGKGMERVILEPDEKTVDAVKQVFPSKVVLN